MCAHSLASAPRTAARRNATTAVAVATTLLVAIRPVATSKTSHTRSARDPGSRLMASQNAWAGVAGVFRGDGGEVTWRRLCPAYAARTAMHNVHANEPVLGSTAKSGS